MIVARLTSKPGLLVLPGILCFLILYHVSTTPGNRLPHVFQQHPHLDNCSPNLDALKQLELSPKVKYARADVQVSYDATQSKVDQLHFELPEFQNLQVDQPSSDIVFQQCSEPLQLHFPTPPPPPDFSHITFGAATTVERLEESMNEFEHWIYGTNARFIAYLEPAASSDISRLKERARAMGFTLIVEQSDMVVTDRFFSLARLIYEQRIVGTTKWGIILDDDTFIISPSTYASYVNSYDHTKPYYIGGVTEDFGQIKNFGIFGYGGASIMLSMPLLEQLYAVHDECLADKTGGDIMLAKCIYGHTGTKLTMEHRMHQFDMNGDLSGLYEAGASPMRQQMLTVHHWKSWHNANMTNMGAVKSICGGDCLLQRFKFANGWWLTNGYSLVKYSQDIPIDELTIEHTWREDGNYWHSFDPIRPQDEGKISLRVEAVETKGKSVTQFYVRRTKEMDEVFELRWTKP